MAKADDDTPWWVAALWLLLYAATLAVIGFGCPSNYRWSVGD